MKKIASIVLAILLVCLVAGCSKEQEPQEVYFLNFKPEIAEVYETKVAPAFAKKGVARRAKSAAAIRCFIFLFLSYFLFCLLISCFHHHKTVPDIKSDKEIIFF